MHANGEHPHHDEKGQERESKDPILKKKDKRKKERRREKERKRLKEKVIG